MSDKEMMDLAKHIEEYNRGFQDGQVKPPQNEKARLDLIRWRAQVLTSQAIGPQRFEADEMRYVLNELDTMTRRYQAVKIEFDNYILNSGPG